MPTVTNPSRDSSPHLGQAFGTGYNPDVLLCLANLSSDEVFTPPGLAN